MSVTNTIILSLSTLLIIIAFAILLFYIHKRAMKHNLSQRFFKAVNSIDANLQVGNETYLTRFKNIASYNHMFKDVYEELSEIDDDMSEIIKRFTSKAIQAQYETFGKNETPEIGKEVLLEKIQKDIVEDFEKRVVEDNAKLLTLNNKFNAIIERHLASEEVIMAEYSWYRKAAEEVLSAYNNKIELFERIRHYVDKLIIDLTNCSDTLHDNAYKINHKELGKNLDTYINLLSHFAEIVKDTPSIVTYFDITIPKLSKELIEKWKSIKESDPHFLVNLNFNEQMREIAKYTNHARETFINLDFYNSKESVKNTLAILQNLDIKIDNEIECKRVVNENIDKVVSSHELIVNRLHALQAIEKNLNDRKIDIKKHLVNLFRNSEKMAEQLSHDFNVLNSNLTEHSYTWQSKLTLLKQVSKTTLHANRLCNDIDFELYQLELDIEKTKYQLENTHHLLSLIDEEITRSNLRFENEQLVLINELKSTILDINNHIDLHGVGDKTVSTIEKLINKVYKIANVISPEIKFAEITRNLMSHFAAGRALSNKLNATLTEAERSYMSGEYSQALNSIITTLEEGIN